MTDNIDFSIIDDDAIETDFDINELMKNLDMAQNEMNQQNYDDLALPQIINYSMNFTVKELFLICEYYGISKELKANKCKKGVIIQILVDFETNPLNSDIVFKRQNMWFYVNELKNDKFMKKFILW
jgi:hypothetical protein